MNYDSDREPASMRQIDFSGLRDTRNFEDIALRVNKTLQDVRAQGIQRIGFVSGRVGVADADVHVVQKTMQEDMATMRKQVLALQNEYGFPVFASTNIFDVAWPEEVQNLSQEERSAQMKQLFRKILSGGSVTDIFMLEGWEQAPGAVDEFETASERRLTIHK